MHQPRPGGRAMSKRVLDQLLSLDLRPSIVGVVGGCSSIFLIKDSLMPKKAQALIPICGSPSTNMCVTRVGFQAALNLKCR